MAPPCLCAGLEAAAEMGERVLANLAKLEWTLKAPVIALQVVASSPGWRVRAGDYTGKMLQLWGVVACRA